MKIFEPRKSPRLKGYDYSQNGAYFVTLCSVNRLPLFGDISDGTMHLSELGVTAQNTLEGIPGYWSQAEVDHFVVMPNHIHVIILILHSPLKESLQQSEESAPLTRSASTPTLPRIIGAYKAGVTRIARQQNIIDSDAILWQRSYHDHIIRDEQSLNRLRHYIELNPAQWDIDTLHPNKE